MYVSWQHHRERQHSQKRTKSVQKDTEKGARGSAARKGHVHTETDKIIQREQIARGSTARNGHVCAGIIHVMGWCKKRS